MLKAAGMNGVDASLTVYEDNPRTPRTVFFAEDDDVLRMFVSESLEKRGFRVVQFSTGGELARWLESHVTHPEPALLVSDVYMPGTTVFDLYQKYPDVMGGLTVIVLTGFGGDALYEQAMALGVRAVIDKPFEMKVLVDTIHRVCE